MAGQGSRKGGKRKHGRDKDQCAAYRASDRREHNKAKKLVKHLKRFPADETAKDALKRLPVHCQRASGGLADEFKAFVEAA